jgi:hypothetical protein
MATAIDIAFLLVYVLGAFAYGSATLLSLRGATAVWSPHRPCRGGGGPRLDTPSLMLFAWSAVWFVVASVELFEDFVVGPRRGWLDVVELLLVFGFPPLIMHSMAVESELAEWPERRRRWGRVALAGGYAASVTVGLYALALIFGVIRPTLNPNTVIGGAIAGLFTMAGVFSATAMSQPRERDGLTESRRLRRTLNGLFLGLVVVNLAYVWGQGTYAAAEQMNKLMAAVPLMFLSATTYHENRVEFYDLLVKRGALLLAVAVALGGYFLVAMPWLDRLPDDAARPWLFAVALLPAVMAVPALSAALGRRLDQAWFGRHYTPVAAVTAVLGAVQPATDEASLITAAEGSLKDVLGVTVRLLTEPPADDAPTQAAFVVDGSPADPSVWVVVPRVRGERVLLSEDLTLLRSLGAVVTYLIENVRLQQRRQEQDLREQELRVQSSQSELKALRAQINPHFLFNALNTVASLIHSNPARADRAVEQLSEVFRHTLRRSDREWAALDHELTFATAYLDVEEARFGDRLRYTVEADGEARRALVPSMLVHTLVENAVKHGIAQRRGSGTLDIRASVAAGRLVLTVTDNGPGPQTTPEAVASARRNGEQFGLRSVRDRLQGHFGDDARFALDRDEALGVTVARVEMPVVTPDARGAGAVELRA